jgi:diguanylate cyclase (GGDEF)-like protein
MSERRDRARQAQWPLRAYLALTSVCVLGSLLDGSTLVRTLCFVLVALATAAAMACGPRLFRTEDPVTWRRLLVVCLLFALSPPGRRLLEHAHGIVLALPDVVMLGGYALTMATFWRVLRLRGGRQADAILDVAVITVGAALLSISFLIPPMLTNTEMPTWVAVMTSAYPVLDVALLGLTITLSFTTGGRVVSVLLIRASTVALLLGDVAYNVHAWSGQLSGPPILNLPFLVAFVLLGAAALHPSMSRLSSGRQESVQAWSWRRLLLLVPALVVPSLLILPDADLPWELRVVQAVGTVALVAALLVRAGRAVHHQTESRRVFEHMATHDSLTELLTRSAVNERLDELISLGRAVNVYFIDLDGFKLVNDSWGHAMGDHLLVEVAARMRRVLPSHVLMSRAGGDEFILVTPVRAQDSDGVVFAENLIAELSQPFALPVGEVVVTCSIGIATSTSGVRQSATDLIRDADTAMYRAKDAGRNRAVGFEPSMGAIVRGRVELDRALRQALGRGELDVAYQPIVDLVTGTLLGFEALARWNRPDEGPSTPDVFIAAAEDNGLILPIGDFIMGRALDELLRWRADSPRELSVNVNVSGRQLQDSQFTGRVLAALARRDLPASALRLEVTESTLVGDDAVAVQSLNDLERAGVRVSVDDFGTGYSSLSYVSRLRVHEVKIDRSFVSGLTTRPEDHAIVRATAAMAQALGLDVVAEGIETKEQSQSLVELGITRGQGWWLGRPLPADRAAELVGQQWTPAVSVGVSLPPTPRQP